MKERKISKKKQTGSDRKYENEKKGKKYRKKID